jgi:GTP cyclohydrolase I
MAQVESLVARADIRPFGAPVDVEAAAQAVTDLLKALGHDPYSEDLEDTPMRVAEAYRELLEPRPFSATTFANDEGYDELVVVRGVSFRSLCRHHLLPFSGVAHVGYIPGARLIGLSKLARVVEHASSGLQVQESITRRVADWLAEHLDPVGAGVVIDAEHACMTQRGVRAVGSRTVTSAMVGQLRTDPLRRKEFLALAGAAASH